MCVSWSAAAVAVVSVVLNTRLSNASFLVDHITTNLTAAVNNSVTQQDIAVSPPLPILQIGLEHILAQININTSTPGTLTPTARTAIYATSEVEALDTRDTLAACGPSQPCIDGSCCNSDGKCGFTSYNCQTTATATCISNCNAYAMCGMDSLNSATSCPLNLCCSNYGYCGTTELYCINSTATYCQEGYGNCQIVPSASCDISDGTASQGRKVAYWQSGNVRWRPCNRIGPSQINTTSLTHLIFAFAAIDPTTFEIVPVDPGDLSTYLPFTDLKSAVMQTWIGIGGGGFTDPGSPTITTWSDMCSSATSRAAFISSLEGFMTTWGFQGVDLDWEYPAVASRGGQPYDTENFVSLVQEMRASWGSRFGISISIPIDFSDLMGYDVEHMQESLDFFNAMAYDLHGSWEASYLGAEVRSQTSIIDITADTQPLWFAYVNPWKINLGLAYYGRGYTLSNASCTDIGCPYSGPNLPGPCTDSPGLLSLEEIDTLIEQKGLIPKLITDEMVKQITWDDQWMGYDDDETFTLKRQWADSKCLGGTVAWSIDFNSGVRSGESEITITTSGTCGPTTTGVETCTGSTFGDCCSVNGYCGSAPAYCSIELGCQASFGNCSSEGLAISVDGSCGAGKTCQGSAFGNCCSSAGWCGSTDAYCGAGCQNTLGTCGSS